MRTCAECHAWVYFYDYPYGFARNLFPCRFYYQSLGNPDWFDMLLPYFLSSLLRSIFFLLRDESAGIYALRILLPSCSSSHTPGLPLSIKIAVTFSAVFAGPAAITSNQLLIIYSSIPDSHKK